MKKKVIVEMQESEFIDFVNWGKSVETATQIKLKVFSEKEKEIMREKIRDEEYKAAYELVADIETAYKKKSSKLKASLIALISYSISITTIFILYNYGVL